jgi:DNA primase
MNLLTLISHDTTLRRTSAKHGGEYSGPCPFCRLGADRFKVWPAVGRWACLGREAGRSGCDISGDAIQYLRQKDDLTYAEACERLGLRPGEPCARRRHDPLTPSLAPETVTPPAPAWQAAGRSFVERCRRRLWTDDGVAARQWLAQRGLSEETLLRAQVGYHPRDSHPPRTAWGLDAGAGQHQTLWLPRGIVLPWFVGSDLWRINVRRPLTPAQCAAGEAKYIGPAGFANGLYGADSLADGKPVVLVEGEIDALTVAQTAGDLAAAVATGSTAGSPAQRLGGATGAGAGRAGRLRRRCQRRRRPGRRLVDRRAAQRPALAPGGRQGCQRHAHGGHRRARMGADGALTYPGRAGFALPAHHNDEMREV